MGKKSLAALLCATMAMTACMLPATAAMADEPLKIEFFQQKGEEGLQKGYKEIIDKFNKENSDIDIMILTSMSEDEIRIIENQVYDIAYDYQLSDNIMISVNIKNADHFHYWLGALPYYDNVEKEGVVLAG